MTLEDVLDQSAIRVLDAVHTEALKEPGQPFREHRGARFDGTGKRVGQAAHDIRVAALIIAKPTTNASSELWNARLDEDRSAARGRLATSPRGISRPV